MRDLAAVQFMEEGRAHGDVGQGGGLVPGGQSGEKLEGSREEETSIQEESEGSSDDDVESEEGDVSVCKAFIGNPEQFFSRFGALVALASTCFTSVTNLIGALGSGDWTTLILNCVFLGLIEGPTTVALLYFFVKEPMKALIKLVARCVGMRPARKRRQDEELFKFMEGKINHALDFSDEHKAIQANGYLKGPREMTDIPDFDQGLGGKYENAIFISGERIPNGVNHAAYPNDVLQNSLHHVTTDNQLILHSDNKSHGRLYRDGKKSPEVVLDPSKYTNTMPDTGNGHSDKVGAAAVVRFNLPEEDIHTAESTLKLKSNSKLENTAKEGRLRGILKKRQKDNYGRRKQSSRSTYDDTYLEHKAHISGSVTEVIDNDSDLSKSFSGNNEIDDRNVDGIETKQGQQGEVKDEMTCSVAFSQTQKASSKRKRGGASPQQNGASLNKRHLPNIPGVNETGSDRIAVNMTGDIQDLTDEIQTISGEALDLESSIQNSHQERQFNGRRMKLPFSAKFFYVMRHVCWQ